jgi:4-hydroxyacetophenone monooxygenase
VSDIDLTQLDRALAAAHQPALQAALVHLTGEDHWLRPEWAPAYVPLSRGDTGVPDAEQKKFLAEAKVALADWFGKGGGRTHQPSAATLRRMMSFVAGAEIPEGYADFLGDELSLAETNTKTPVWDAPRLKEGAAKMHVLVIGAGMSGLLTGIRLSQAGVSYEILDKNADVGGTWFENTYPGCRVDSSNHIYSYSFEPNHHWPQHFSTQPILLEYFRGVADRYDLRGKIAFETEVETLDWDEARALWKVTVRDKAGVRRLIEANAVVTAVGQLNRPRMPDIKGRDSFAGPAFHSARWRHDVDLTGKRVAVIGTGASAYQFVPEIAGKVGSLTVFQRTPPWVLPKMDAVVSEAWQRRFERFPILQSLLRQALYRAFERLNASLNRPKARRRLEARARRNIERATQDETLRRKLTPDFAIGCKRILQSNTWYRALARQNVDVVSGVAEVRGNTIIATDGASCEVDLIIFGTGFEVANPPVAEIIVGASGRTLADQWQGSPEVYVGTTAPDAPNCFLMFGPNLYTFSSAFVMIEAQLDYIMDALRQAGARKITSLSIRADVCRSYNEVVQAALQSSVWNSGGCTSYFIDRNGRNSTNWPWSAGRLRRRLRRFRLRDYEVQTGV